MGVGSLRCVCGQEINLKGDIKLKKIKEGEKSYIILCPNELCHLKLICKVKMGEGLANHKVVLSKAFKEWNEVILGPTKASKVFNEFKLRVVEYVGFKVSKIAKLFKIIKDLTT